MSVNEVLEAVRALSPEERAKVRALIDTLSEVPSSPEEAARLRLCQAGFLSETMVQGVGGRVRHTPVEIKGRPLSETIIGER